MYSVTSWKVAALKHRFGPKPVSLSCMMFNIVQLACVFVCVLHVSVLRHPASHFFFSCLRMSAVEVHVDTSTSCSPHTSGWLERMEEKADFDLCTTVSDPCFCFTDLKVLGALRGQWCSVRLFEFQVIEALKVVSSLYTSNVFLYYCRMWSLVFCFFFKSCLMVFIQRNKVDKKLNSCVLPGSLNLPNCTVLLLFLQYLGHCR